MKHKLLLLYSWFVRIALFWLPDVPFIMRFRGWLYGLGMKSCGRDFQVTHNADLNGLETFVVGNHSYLANNVKIITAEDGYLYIGDEVMIAPNSVIVTGDHAFFKGSFRYASAPSKEVVLKNGSWVAANCTVLPGAVLPTGSVLAANSCLSKAFETPCSMYGGVPAIHIKKLIASHAHNDQ